MPRRDRLPLAVWLPLVAAADRVLHREQVALLLISILELAARAALAVLVEPMKVRALAAAGQETLEP
jgi:hypothetical protein